mmetsp:Transcript_17272/g.44247  ORF Transcript_17272/g.44247 Transcript_17272/m.44247 type:complete len:109 (+) Transcript_17272:47-373(+)
MSPTRHLSVVTGANKGVGFAIATQLLASGMDVLIGCRSVELGEAAASRLGASCRFAQLDISDSSSIANFVEAVSGPVDVLVNNAGIAFKKRRPDTVLSADAADSRREF